MKKKYVRVMNGNKSHANGYEFKIGEVNISDKWNPKADNPDDFGGFNFSTEDKILRYLHRGDTIYDVEIPKGAEVVEVDSKNAPHGIFRTNKIIIFNQKIVTEELVIDLYKKLHLPEKTYYQCLVTLLYKNHIEAVKYIIKDRINETNIDDAIKEFEEFVVYHDNKKFNYEKLWNEAKEIYDILKEIQSDLLISLYIDKEPFIKTITKDNIINITGESGSGKSYFTKKWINNDKYIIIDTDILFSEKETDKEYILDLRKILINKYNNNFKDLLITNFDDCYQIIIDYFKDSGKTIVIDSAQYRNLKDISILKGQLIVMRTCIDTCYERCITRYKNNNPNYNKEELENYKNKKIKMYSWYKGLNDFLVRVHD